MITLDTAYDLTAYPEEGCKVRARAARLVPGGFGATATISTQLAAATHLIQKAMIRMDAWLNDIRPN